MFLSQKGWRLKDEHGNSAFTGILSHWNYDSFQLSWNKKWDGKDMVSFNLDTEGKVAEMRMGRMSFKKVK